MTVEQLLPAICASTICLGIWGGIAAVAGLLAHRRMVSAERAIGAPALPPDEWPYIWYAGASIVWLSALLLAVVGLLKRPWARAGRNCTFLFLGHMTLATAAATVAVVSDASHGGGDSPLPLVAMACVIVGASAIAATAFAWRLAGARTARLEARPREGNAPGLERWAIYAASGLLWPAGIAAAVMYDRPENVRVGANALRISTVALALLAIATCVGLVAVVAIMEGRAPLTP